MTQVEKILECISTALKTKGRPPTLTEMVRACGASTNTTQTTLGIMKRSGLDGITWDVLQAIKDDVLGSDVMAIEMYPRDCDLVYEINARHLWEVPAEYETRMPTLLLR